MNRLTKWITLLLGSALIAAAALGAVVVVGLTNASAQVETPKISSEIEFSAGEPGFQHWPGGTRPGGRTPGRTPEGNQFLADALGIPLEDLQEAQEAVRIEAIEIALEEGLITEEQAEQMKEGRSSRRGGPYSVIILPLIILPPANKALIITPANAVAASRTSARFRQRQARNDGWHG